jgi:hypothetical protein
MANPANLQAQQLVNDLRAAGLSYAEIGRRVGRDSSLISQIGRKGNKGASLVGALQGIQGGASSVNVARRTTKSGVTAKVRAGVKPIPGTSNFTVKTKRGNKTLLAGVNSVSGQGKYLKWNIRVSWLKTISDRKYKNTGVSGHLPHGWTTDDLYNRIARPQAGDNWHAGDIRGALKEIAMSQNQDKLVSAGAVLDVELYSLD